MILLHKLINVFNIKQTSFFHFLLFLNRKQNSPRKSIYGVSQYHIDEKHDSLWKPIIWFHFRNYEKSCWQLAIFRKQAIYEFFKSLSSYMCTSVTHALLVYFSFRNSLFHNFHFLSIGSTCELNLRLKNTINMFHHQLRCNLCTYWIPEYHVQFKLLHCLSRIDYRLTIRPTDHFALNILGWHVCIPSCQYSQYRKRVICIRIVRFNLHATLL